MAHNWGTRGRGFESRHSDQVTFNAARRSSDNTVLIEFLLFLDLARSFQFPKKHLLLGTNWAIKFSGGRNADGFS